MLHDCVATELVNLQAAVRFRHPAQITFAVWLAL
jgi:hypothetical protein